MPWNTPRMPGTMPEIRSVLGPFIGSLFCIAGSMGKRRAYAKSE